ncbi:MAG: methyltransferase [Gemmobacter sp.]
MVERPDFAPEDLSDDGFLGGRLRIWQPRRGYRGAADPVLLAAAVPARPGQTVLELGCGAGVASLCLGARVAGLDLAGLELQPAYAALARRNAERNRIALAVHGGDLAAMPAALRRGFDHVIANPPYYPARAGTAARDPGRETALREATPLADWIAAARRRLHPGGWLTLILSADRLPELLGALGSGFGSAALLPLAPRAGRPATRAILRARKCGRGAFRLLAPMVLHQGAAHDGDRDSYTPEARAILREAAALSPFG